MSYDQPTVPHLITTGELRQLAWRVRELEELICNAAPSAWVATQDVDGAKKWEVEAAWLLYGKEEVVLARHAD